MSIEKKERKKENKRRNNLQCRFIYSKELNFRQRGGLILWRRRRRS